MLGQRMESEIREQPRLLRKNWLTYTQCLQPLGAGKEFEMIVLEARGSSDNAALYGRYLVEIYLGIPALLAAPSVLTRYGVSVRYQEALVVGISQSGAAPDVAEVLEAARKKGHKTLAITNTAESKISEVADLTLELNLGQEQAVAATKTYSASLLALYAVVKSLGGELDDPMLPDDEWVEECYSSAERAVETAIATEQLFSLARGIRFCSADEAALKMMECALLPCLPYSLADFQHGPRALAQNHAAAILFGKAQAGPDIEGFRMIRCPERPGVPESVQPIWDSIFAQWLALLCARKRILDPDRPEGLSKVTKTL